MEPVAWVFVYASITALATGLGAVPFAFVRDLSPRVVAWANAIAAGLMLGASFGLLTVGTSYGSLQTLIGAVVNHFASGEFGEGLLGGPLFTAEAVRRRKQEIVTFMHHGLMAGAPIGGEDS